MGCNSQVYVWLSLYLVAPSYIKCFQFFQQLNVPSFSHQLTTELAYEVLAVLDVHQSEHLTGSDFNSSW